MIRAGEVLSGWRYVDGRVKFSLWSTYRYRLLRGIRHSLMRYNPYPEDFGKNGQKVPIVDACNDKNQRCKGYDIGCMCSEV